MNVKVVSKVLKLVSFSSLYPGDIFKFENESFLYLKITPINKTGYDFITLNSGMLCYRIDDFKVIKMKPVMVQVEFEEE